MTMSMKQLEQLAALAEARDRVLELREMCVPLVGQLAAEGNSLARYIVDQLELAEQAMALASMDGHAFLEEHEKPA